ncbi:TetR family transcriptional regulator [Mycobacteroides abscessus]|uniref:TetR/AcrR family transcriptional regulator n=1 Tax=Mycobacteroides abscessus TaxID=36809 RepID=UPI0005E1DAA7|nr:TetR family transcriptional regulator [Mycobacteroides abscessus]MDM2646328.1 TetR family transcriptional regulator [Mycobacteroides abscessus]MDM2655215.1 TetR family transcriptional regulator [Mycobacteroides abscessus]MDM2665003.1 TetR family transcriptional regulator [Mycobacteroides abscessus]MDM2670516.1 TetR family transcriptional regulator [Mycobacteroides abscessus]MDM2674381.1 TetR family transcriptional regulator [Mycobacteroides abscessus]
MGSRSRPQANTVESAQHRPKGLRARQKILVAARQVFSEVGYERATIRRIADAAGVDKSSLTQYFGTKENLFQQSVHWEIPMNLIVGETASQTAENFTRGILMAWAIEPVSPMATLLRASLTNNDAADLLRRHITAQVVDAMEPSIEGDDVRLRIALAGSMLMGVVSQYYMIQLPDLKIASTDKIVQLVAPLIRSLIEPGCTEEGEE